MTAGYEPIRELLLVRDLTYLENSKLALVIVSFK